MNVVHVRDIRNIELTNICDNACVYCPCSRQKEARDLGFMTFDTFHQTLKWCKKFMADGTQNEINLFGIGESLLHPRLIEFVAHARQFLGPDALLHLNTNGNNVTRENALALVDAGLTSIDVTVHKYRAAANAIRVLKNVGIIRTVSFGAVLEPNNWAGQVDWLEPDYRYPCPWLGTGQVMVLVDGRVSRCCLDAFARGIYGTIWDDLSSIEVSPFELCKTCHQTHTLEYKASCPHPPQGEPLPSGIERPAAGVFCDAEGGAK